MGGHKHALVAIAVALTRVGRRGGWSGETRSRMERVANLARVGAWALGIAFALYYWLYLTTNFGSPSDAYAYWAANPAGLYGSPSDPVRPGSYLYSPAFELIVGWGRLLPFVVFAAIWRAILLVVLVWLAGPLTFLVLLFVPVASDINAGNIQILLAAAIVVGFRHPGSWAFVLLTKFTCGLGLLWFALRGETKSLLVAFGVAATVMVASVIMWPERWLSYVSFVLQGSPNLPAVPPYYLPLWVRLPVATAVAGFGALRGWRWSVVVAATIALPILYVPSFALLVGVLPFMRAAANQTLSGLRPPPGVGRPAGQPA